MNEPDYAVLRPAPGLSSAGMGDYFGKWIDITLLPVNTDEDAEEQRARFLAAGGTVGTATVTPTDRFEFREDGACAQVWEVSW